MSVSKVSARPMGIRMPTQKELIAAYRSIVNARMKEGKLTKLAKAPANAEKYPHYNITDPRLLGSRSDVYVIKGQLYLKQTPVVPNAHSTWFKVGPAPMF